MLQKPNQKSIMSSVVAGSSIVVGAKVGDSIAAAMPESTNGYKKWLLGLGGLLLAASVNSSTTTGKAVQNAFLGMGGKQLYDGVTELMTEQVSPQTSNTTSARMINAFVGHSETSLQQLASSVDWIPRYDNQNVDEAWNRVESQTVAFVGV